MVRKISAHYLFTGQGKPLKRGIVVIDQQGEIVDLIDTDGDLTETEKLEFYEGIITPGFVNAHAHLELSHLKGQIPQHTGLTVFIKKIGQLRHVQDTHQSMINADRLMRQNGIVAVGDISNSDISFAVKAASQINYYTFIEIFGIQENIAQEKMESGIGLYQKLGSCHLPGSLAPHAPYSMSETLWQLLSTFVIEHNLPWSVHNQESHEENLLYLHKTGKIAEFLTLLTREFDDWEAKKISSLSYCKKFYTDIPKLLLVHNTFTSLSDLESISELRKKVFMVLCPNANLYIENKLPDIEMLSKSGFTLSLGTDSLASNTTLSVLEEMKTIQQHFPAISLTDLITWGTINGARALGMETHLGSIEKGKKPGLNLITHINFQEMKLTSQSEVKVLS
jgi:cytosine/adenosine deaminase-related metal-dependent hydrolase